MIDFRYHLVSLMAVLVALTMGVVLGAGPLQGKISDTLTGQVSQLSKQQAELRETNEELVKQANSNGEYIGVLGRKLTPGTMTDKKVAVIRMPGVKDEVMTGLNTQIKVAGAAITNTVTVKDAWFSEDSKSYRDSLASTLASKLGDKVDAKVSTQRVLSTALAAGLTSDDTEVQALVANLSAGDVPLVKASTVTDPAEFILVVSPDSNEKDTKDSVLKLDLEFVKGIDTVLPKGTVIVGSAKEENSYLTQIRAEKLAVSTVDGVGSVMSKVSTPFALLADQAGTNQAYGTQQYATQLIPPVPTPAKEG
ncbi:copper transporter [Varibaculum vaginae]|uniref:copper transporter n=1 Tax=Varibaculum vaginae TaxID=2364797 RepID=UPI000F092BDB|nr:copper transporter [Varibaculum vaginae]